MASLTITPAGLLLGVLLCATLKAQVPMVNPVAPGAYRSDATSSADRKDMHGFVLPAPRIVTERVLHQTADTAWMEIVPMPGRWPDAKGSEATTHYAEVQQTGSWQDAEVTDVAWLEQLAAQRDVIGSAHANAWLHALGHDLPEEIIILPEDGPKSAGQPRTHAAIEWDTGMLLEAFPNPSNGPLFVVYEVAEGSAQAELRLLDIHGRTMRSTRLGDGPGLLQWETQGLAPGMYVAELRVDGMVGQQVKVVVQR